MPFPLNLSCEDLEHEHGVEGGLSALLPVVRGVTGELFEQRAAALSEDDVTQFENASGLGCDGLFMFNRGEKFAASFSLAITLHARPLRVRQLGERGA